MSPGPGLRSRGTSTDHRRVVGPRVREGPQDDGDVLPGTLLLAFGLGISLPAVQGAALNDTTDDDAGLASGVHATVSHLGGSVGLAVFVAVAVAGLETGLEEGKPLASATAAGHSSTWLIATGLLVVGAVLSAVFIRPARPARTTPPPAAVP